jgi:hypothetical protein
MIRITKSAIYGPGDYNYPEPHQRQGIDVAYQPEDRVIITVDAEDSETRQPYTVYLTRHINLSDGWMQSATIDDIEGEFPAMTDEQWIKAHWEEISDAQSKI